MLAEAVAAVAMPMAVPMMERLGLEALVKVGRDSVLPESDVARLRFMMELMSFFFFFVVLMRPGPSLRQLW